MKFNPERSWVFEGAFWDALIFVPVIFAVAFDISTWSLWNIPLILWLIFAFTKLLKKADKEDKERELIHKKLIELECLKVKDLSGGMTKDKFVELIDEQIEIQRKFLGKRYDQSINWRIIGLQELRMKVKSEGK